MAATNRAELLDPALLRSGRFDRIISCPLPDSKGRLQILRVHTKKLRLAGDVDLDKIARFTGNLSGKDYLIQIKYVDIYHLCNITTCICITVCM